MDHFEAAGFFIGLDIAGIVELQVLADQRAGGLDDVGRMVQAAQRIDHLQLQRVAALELYALAGFAGHAQHAAHDAVVVAQR